MGGGEPCQLVEETAGDPFSHFFSRVVDGGEFGVNDLRYHIIVKTYDSDVFRHPDASFLQRKKIEKELGLRYPKQFVSVYEMVSFSHTPYNTALHCIQNQDQLLQRIMQQGDFFENTKQDEFNKQLDNWVSEYYHAVQQLETGNEA